MKRVFLAALATETNTFAPIPTERRHFEEWFLYRAGEHPHDGPTLFTAPLWSARKHAAEFGWTLIEGLCAAAFPSGRTVRSVYEALRDELLDDLRAALPVDIVLLGLHGAMAADGYDDCEGDLLRRIRSLCGPSTIIAAELDPHCHLTEEMVEASDLLAAFQEYPHTDAMERADHLVRLARDASEKKITPVTAVADARMSAQVFTKQAPALNLVNAMKAAERSGEVLSASLGHSFAAGDVADMTVRAWVITDNAPEQAIRSACRFRDMAWAMKETCGARRMTGPEAIEFVGKVSDRVILAEGADNSGGGAPSDSMELIRTLMGAGVGPIAAGPIWDPLAVEIAIARGVGARFELRIGGKACALSGRPLDLNVEVIKIRRGATQCFGGSTWPMGDMVGLKSGNVFLALSTVRNQAFTPEIFTGVGIDPEAQRVLVLKSNHHFRDAFTSLSNHILYMSTPGVAICDPRAAHYLSVRRPLWPLDSEASAQAAQTSWLKGSSQ